jgi:hypothetical protein
MKVFWSWQADTPGKTGRHFVRAALADAIEALKQPEEIEEPAERDAREALHLDHDRQGVSGSPDLAPTIFRKIDQSTVFVADVTLVGRIQGEGLAGEDTAAKKLINSNVAIEYGYALHALGDPSILTVQNVHYGEREELPFDLKHKAGPIQFRLAPNAAKSQIAAERAKLRGDFIKALRPYLRSGHTTTEPPREFEETPSTTSIAFFWDPPYEALATAVVPSEKLSGGDVTIEYRFEEPRAFYLRLIPIVPLARPLRRTALVDVVRRRPVQVLTRTPYGAMPCVNRFGAIAYKARSASTTLLALTQLFRNGEIWGVSEEFAITRYNETVVPMVNVENIYSRVLADYVSVASEELGVSGPYQVEMGAIGLVNMRLLSNKSGNSWGDTSELIYDPALRVRRILNETSAKSQGILISEFLDELFDLGAVVRG